MRSTIVATISIIILGLIIGVIIWQCNKDYFYKFGGHQKSDFVLYTLGFKTEDLPRDYLYPGEFFYRWKTAMIYPVVVMTPEAHESLKNVGCCGLNFEYFPDRTHIEISVINANRPGNGNPPVDDKFNWLDGFLKNTPGADCFYKPIELFGHKNETFQIIQKNTFKINGQLFSYAKARVISRNKPYTALVTYKITDSGKYLWTIYARTPGKEVNMQALNTILKMTKLKYNSYFTR